MFIAISMMLIVSGVILLQHGAGGFRLIGSEVVRLLTRPRRGRDCWLLLGGVVATIFGSVSLCRGMGWF